MKYILAFSMVLFCCSCVAQNSKMSHMVNGKKVFFSKADSAAIAQGWIVGASKIKADSIQLAQMKLSLLTIKATAQSAEGVSVTSLTAAQVRALLAVMLFNHGGVDPKTLQVLPLNQWVQNPIPK